MSAIQEPSASTAINPTPTNVFLPTGANPRESTTECVDDSRDKLLCHRFVYPSTNFTPRRKGRRKRNGIMGLRESKYRDLTRRLQIGYGTNKKTRHLMPSGHKAFLVHNEKDVDLLLMHNRTYAAEYVSSNIPSPVPRNTPTTPTLDYGKRKSDC
jgi:hypothetical protein